MKLNELITTKQQEAREQFSHEFGRGAYEEVVHEKMLPVLDVLILSTAHSVLDALKELVPELLVECSDFHKLSEGTPWTPCGLCGLRRDEQPKRDGMDYAHEGWNEYRAELLSRLERFSSNEE